MKLEIHSVQQADNQNNGSQVDVLLSSDHAVCLIFAQILVIRSSLRALFHYFKESNDNLSFFFTYSIMFFFF